jgi:ubiquitin-protein ligase
MFHPNVYGDGSLCLDVLQVKFSLAARVAESIVSVVLRGCGAGASLLLPW